MQPPFSCNPDSKRLEIIATTASIAGGSIKN
jgi:hypothetical protein